MTCGRAISAAIIRRTQMRAALKHLARNLDLGHAGVVARVLRPPRGFSGIQQAFGTSASCLPTTNRWSIPTRCRSCRRRHSHSAKCGHRRGALVAIKPKILMWEHALPGVRHLCHQASTRPPTRTRRLRAHRALRIPIQLRSANPCRPISHKPQGVLIGDVNDGMIRVR